MKLIIGLCLIMLVPNLGLHAQETKEKELQFLRLTEGEKELQTAITRYTIAHNMRTVTVDMVSAVHIGEESYYSDLDKRFEGYEKLLYELVAPEGVVPDGTETKSDNPLAMLQGGMKSFLGLESQTIKINYKAKNFVHADLTPTEVQQKMAERGDTTTTLMIDAVNHMLRQQNLAATKAAENGEAPMQIGFEELTGLLQDPAKAKQFMAKQFVSPEAMMMGGSLGQLLIADRNQEAIKELERQMEDQDVSNIGIFYGAAHMDDFDKRLKEMGFKYQSQTWVTAWDLTKGPEKKEDPLMQLLENLLK